EGVYPLPEAQRDRFLLKVSVGHPRGREEFEILRRMSVSPPTANRVLSPDLIRELRDAADHVFIHNLVAEYIVRMVLATRSTSEFQLPELDGVIEVGVSPRATLGLASAARALALIHGRNYVLPQDVAAVARDVMSHRIMLTFDAAADGVDERAVVDRVVSSIAPPQPVWNGTGQPAFR
nr:MoxR family ATPase [Nocardioidaceae bacterium]